MLRVLALFTVLIWVYSTSAAGTVQTVRFAQTGKILVWVDGVMVGQGAEVSLGKGERSVEPIFGNGRLEPTESSPIASHRIVFSVASNTGFVLETDAPFETGEVSVRILETGENAQALARTPADRSRRIFEQADRTAIGRGAPLSQSLTLEVISNGRRLDGLTIKATES